MQKTLVILESPYAPNGDNTLEENIEYARMCVRDSIKRGEAPMASHLLYTQEGILNDNIPEERQLGIETGLAWHKFAEKTVVYYDLGITKGMKHGIEKAKYYSNKIEYRSIIQ